MRRSQAQGCANAGENKARPKVKLPQQEKGRDTGERECYTRYLRSERTRLDRAGDMEKVELKFELHRKITRERPGISNVR
jgi:hypothetical protein